MKADWYGRLTRILSRRLPGSRTRVPGRGCPDPSRVRPPMAPAAKKQAAKSSDEGEG